MRFEPWKCPECGQPAKGVFALVPGLTRLFFDEDGDAEYDGGTDLCWDGLTETRDAEGRVTLECSEGHQWQAATPHDAAAIDPIALEVAPYAPGGAPAGD